MKLTTLLAIFTLSGIFITPIHLQAQEACATDIIHQKALANDPAFRLRVLESEAQLQRQIALSGGARLRGASCDTLPVVVHVLHTGQAEGTGLNISDAQIQSAIDNLNDVFSGDIGNTGTDIPIRFALASRAPGGGATNGINRINATGVEDYENIGITADASRLNLFNLSRWNPAQYINIWTTNLIDNGTSTKGFATLPPADLRYDGIVLLYNNMGYDPTGSLGYTMESGRTQNETLIHEMGHYLNLYHTFQGDDSGCPSDSDCNTDGDLCCDTDPHQRTSSVGCWTGVTNSCTGSYFGTVVQNYMAYSSESCRDRFTSDQIDRMTATISGTRNTLLNGWAFEDTHGASVVTASCTPTTQNIAEGYYYGPTNIEINGQKISTGSALEDNGYVEDTDKRFLLEAGTTYSVSVSNSGVGNEFLFIYIDYENDGDFGGSGDDFHFVNANTSWTTNITTPNSPLYNTPIRIRFLTNNTTAGYTNGCANPSYGQAEDYVLYFTSSAALSSSAAALENFNAIWPSSSPAQTFTVSGDDLEADAKLSLSGSDFELSTDGSTYSASLTLNESGGNLQSEPVTIYTRLKSGLSEGHYQDSIAISSTNADTVWVNLSGHTGEINQSRGNALSLDGTGDYALADDYVGITGGNSRTYEAWIKTTDSDGAILANGINSTGQKWIIRLNNGQLRTEINGGYIRGTTNIDDGLWHHIAVVLDNSGGATLSNTTLYVDGSAETISASSGTSSTINTASSQNVWIGNDHSTRYLDGEIDEVRIWSVVKTQTELRTNMHLTLDGSESGLEAYLQFNESTGSAVGEDINGYDFTLNGDATFISSTLDVAGGVCSTVSLGGTGSSGLEVDVNSLQIDFTDGGTAPNGDLVVFLLNDKPAGGNGDNFEATQHWIVRNFGSNQSALNIASIRTTLQTSDPLLAYDETTMSLYKRASGSDGSWTTVASSAATTDPASGEIFFNSLSGFTGFSQLSVGNSGLLLPVNWQSFSAVRLNAGEVALEWTTSEEIDCKSYEMEMSYNGKQFSSLGEVACQGQSNGTAHYREVVQESKAAFYRLRQVDFDGKNSFSELRYVEAIAASRSFRVFPNPTNGFVMLQSESIRAEEIVRLELVSSNGQRLLQFSGTLSALNNQLNASLSKLPKGVMLLQVRTDKDTYTQRLLIH
ncbi:MAG: M43 family zinc metalloprotease [Bacteroidota bacterium]